MALIENICPRCGAKLIKKGNTFICKFCKSSFEEQNVIDEDAILKKIDEQSMEMYSKAKLNLWNCAHEEYLSNRDIEKWCDEVRKYSPDDFLAEFYEICLGRQANNLIKLILDIDSKNIYADEVVRFCIKTMDDISIAEPIKSLIEELKNNGIFNSSEYTGYMTNVDRIIDNLDRGIFDIDLPRDVFVTYSSKDIKEVNEVVEYLEENGFTCFTAIRNLRHGMGAKENYQENLYKAMRNSKCMVFISSENSRDNSCDAMRIELPYYKTLEKKGRIEYVIEEYGENTKEVSRIKLKDFFKDLEYCRTLKDLAIRVDNAISSNYNSDGKEKTDEEISDEEFTKNFGKYLRRHVKIKSKVIVDKTKSVLDKVYNKINGKK